jgi:hypothetical protein
VNFDLQEADLIFEERTVSTSPHLNVTTRFNQFHTTHVEMGCPPNKRQKRENYRASLDKLDVENGVADLPKKKFYRQRAHANPFSDHALT